MVHANYKSLNNSDHEVISMEEYQTFSGLIMNEEQYKYYFKRLNGKPSQEDVDAISYKYRGYKKLFKSKYEYEDIYKFEHALESGVFNIYIKYTYRNSLDPIYIRIGSLWYKFFFNLSQHQKNVLPIKECFKDNGFDFVYSSRNDSIYGRAEFRSYLINNRFKERKELQHEPPYKIQHLILELLKGPKKQHIFKNFKLFEIDVENIEERPGYYIYRIGNQDFLVRKK